MAGRGPLAGPWAHGPWVHEARVLEAWVLEANGPMGPSSQRAPLGSPPGIPRDPPWDPKGPPKVAIKNKLIFQENFSNVAPMAILQNLCIR